MSKTYIKKEIVTITRIEEVSVIDSKSFDKDSENPKWKTAALIKWSAWIFKFLNR